jgi:hypothetical protein
MIRDNSDHTTEYDYNTLVISRHWYILNIVICGTPFTSLYAGNHNSKFRHFDQIANTHFFLLINTLLHFEIP